ncbi:neurochondrin [Alosa pseudoharengus]|uniref:neurochondrin n=1 Tax=Alosa pseudoharengus TaxID=34774 RepID=UPI003F8AB83A
MMVMDVSGCPSVPGADEMEGLSAASGDSLSQDQKEMLERCLHALSHAKNDSQTLAALLLITRVCPASQLDRVTLRRVFEAVGLNLPARLLVTAVRGDTSSGLPAQELLSLGSALLAALSTDPDMAQHQQMLSTLPMLLGLLSDGPTWKPQKQRTPQTSQQKETGASPSKCNGDHSAQSSQPSPPEVAGEESGGQTSPSSAVVLNEALASDCYQVLEAVSVVSGGPERLLTRGAIPALCRAIGQSQTLSGQRGRPLLGLLLSQLGLQAWERHSAQLRAVLERLSHEFCQAKEHQRLELCAELVQFLPPQEGLLESGELKRLAVELWAAVRPLVQSKLSTRQLGPVLALSACLLDLCGWDCVGPPRFCCLLVNRACVEVRMGLEEPPGTDMSLDLQHWLTACYRIMEAAMEQACSQGLDDSSVQSQTSLPGLSLQQSRQVLGILEEAFSAVIFYLKQVEQSRHGDPFVFATFRCLCAWLAEETSCLKEEVTSLLPFLIGYSRDHLQGGGDLRDLSSWMADMSMGPGSPKNKWTGEHALRYLLPALCHLTAEEGPRQVLLSLDLLSLLIGLLQRGWEGLQKQEVKAQRRDPALETACSALLNIAVTEPDKVRKDPSFSELQKLLDEALPLLLHKPRLLVLAANFCTLGLMLGRTKVTPSDLTDPGERRFFSAALRFLLGALGSAHGSQPGSVAAAWEEGWGEVGELWSLSLQALGACFRGRPGLTALVREQSWLANILSTLGIRGSRTDAPTLEALQEALCALAQMCPACRDEIREELRGGQASCLKDMKQLRRAVSQ